jgi:hypothetical protein
MAKKQKVNKSQAIRDYLREHAGAANKEVAEALTKSGIKMTPEYVATIKGNMKTRRKARRKAARKVVAKTGIDISQIKAAFGFLKTCGSLAAAKQALAAAEEIKKMV